MSLLLARTTVTACGVSNTRNYMTSSHSQTCMSSTAILVKAQKLEFESDLQNPPTRGTLEDHSSAASPNGSVPSCLRHGRGGVGPSGITCDCKLLRVGSTCRRVVRQVCKAPPNSHILAPACDCACGESILWTDATQA